MGRHAHRRDENVGARVQWIRAALGYQLRADWIRALAPTLSEPIPALRTRLSRWESEGLEPRQDHAARTLRASGCPDDASEAARGRARRAGGAS